MKPKNEEKNAARILERIDNLKGNYRLDVSQESQECIWTQPPFNCSKLTIEKLEQGVKYVQS